MIKYHLSVISDMFQYFSVSVQFFISNYLTDS